MRRRVVLVDDHELVRTGVRVLVGASRKSFTGTLGGPVSAPDERIGGSIAAATIAVLGGAHAVRVHDVAATRQAVSLAETVALARRSSRQSTSAQRAGVGAFK